MQFIKRGVGAFGSLEPRFREAIDEDEEHLGPGSYLSQNIIEKFKVQKPSSEMVAFKAPPRKPFHDVHYNDRDLPGPADYGGHVVSTRQQKGHGRPFDVNERRF